MQLQGVISEAFVIVDTYRQPMLGHSSPPGPDRHETFDQPTNQSWPPPEVARRLNDKPRAEQISVTVRLEFSTGEEMLDGIAARWWKQHVYVKVNDPRLPTWGAWVDAADVERRPVPEIHLGDGPVRAAWIEGMPGA